MEISREPNRVYQLNLQFIPVALLDDIDKEDLADEK